MNINDSVLSYAERLTFSLRELYSKNGYQPYRMSKFEDYDLYSRNKDFLVSDRVITFTDLSGKLKALKPDVTLSIIKNHTDDTTRKLYYNENVYRVSKGADGYKEIMQAGVECIGEVDNALVGESLMLAAQSLELIGKNFVLDVSDLDILNAAVETITDSRHLQEELVKCVSEKNAHGILSICEDNGIDPKTADSLIALLTLCGAPEKVLPKLSDLCDALGCRDAYEELSEALSVFQNTALLHRIQIDFSVVSDRSYYNGVIFKGFLSGVPDSVLSGGRYDKLLHRMKRSSKAVGFAVYLDMLERVEELTPADIPEDTMLNVALPKGRLGEKVYAMFEAAGFPCPSIKENNRKLIFENPEAGVRYFWVKPSDVAIYVERGAADIGVAGKDILLEYEPEVYELLDLEFGKCRMAVAAPKGFEDDRSRTLRVATKFSKIAADHYASKGRDIDIVHLNGSIEIAPILGLTDVIVDIVETGTTLRENNLEVVETIVPISARLIANKSSYKFKGDNIMKIAHELKSQIEVM
ncbi:ATP phosphoribosyltransferase [Ruminococcus sp.]|uniref:ATP phosphoribosyltransferase n=1 Tax=Ruminococcus sp. TaxID=41978 RepID=UPI0038678EF8